MIAITDLCGSLIEHKHMDIGSDGQRKSLLSRHILQQVVASVAEGILLIDARDSDLKIVYANPAYETLSGFSADELVGKSWRLLQRDAERSPELAKLRLAVGCAEPCEASVLDIKRDGTTWFSRIQMSPLLNERGELRYFLCRQRPVEGAVEDRGNVEVDLLQRELGHARQRIASLSRTDPITGLLNHEHFNSLLGRDIAVARREKRRICIVLFEVVEIDVYRKTFGSNAADSCLRMIGAQVGGAFRRAGDLCARRDKSTIVVATRGQDEVEVESSARRVADKVRGLGLHNPRARSGRYLTVRSAVMSIVPEDEDAETLVERCAARLQGESADPPKRQASS